MNLFLDKMLALVVYVIGYGAIATGAMYVLIGIGVGLTWPLWLWYLT